jgi:hypothetical protein
MAGERFFYNTSANGGYLQKANIVEPIIGQLGGSLNNVSGFNPTANAGFMMLFDLGASDLVLGSIPKLSFQVPAGGSFAYGSLLGGLQFQAGMCFAVSTTGGTYTASTDAWWLMAEGRNL